MTRADAIAAGHAPLHCHDCRGTRDATRDEPEPYRTRLAVDYREWTCDTCGAVILCDHCGRPWSVAHPEGRCGGGDQAAG